MQNSFSDNIKGYIDGLLDNVSDIELVGLATANGFPIAVKSRGSVTIDNRMLSAFIASIINDVSRSLKAANMSADVEALTIITPSSQILLRRKGDLIIVIKASPDADTNLLLYLINQDPF
ncbi:MAG: roadblock/LC7 domain-containing protein [Thermocladium sp.]